MRRIQRSGVLWRCVELYLHTHTPALELSWIMQHKQRNGARPGQAERGQTEREGRLSGLLYVIITLLEQMTA